MFRLLTIILILLLVCSFAAAQAPRVEVFGGYSFLHAPGQNLNGWNGAATIFLKKGFGVTADFGGHYWSQSLNPPGLGTISLKTRLYTYSFGPTLAWRNESKFTPFLHLLAGGSHYSFPISTPSGSINPSLNHFTFIGGGGFDIGFARNLALRPVQLEYQGIYFSPGWQNNVRYSAGVVFRWGGM